MAERFLTTHVGSLPRAGDLVAIMWAKEDGLPLDLAAVEARIEAAVHEVVDRQAEAGIDLVNDGEQSKPSYATYIKDRLEGFGGSGTSYVFQDLEEHPDAKARILEDPGRRHRRTPACNGPIRVRDLSAVERDAATLNAALARHPGRRAFMTAASPGVTALFFRNEYYPSEEEYLFALADALAAEYEAIHRAGILLQIDCPDLAMGRHTQFRDLDLAQFRRRIGRNIEALNHATRNIPAEAMRMHLCWGNYAGPHHCDVPLADIIDLVWTARPHAIQFEAANPRHAHEHALFGEVGVPEGKVLIPGMLEPQSAWVEHPELIAQRIGRYAHLVGRERVMAGADCGFSIHAGSGGVPASIVWAKLRALAEGAAIASERFWP